MTDQANDQAEGKPQPRPTLRERRERMLEGLAADGGVSMPDPGIAKVQAMIEKTQAIVDKSTAAVRLAELALPKVPKLEISSFADQLAESDRIAEEIAQARSERERARVKREEQALEVSRAILEQQRLLVAEQVRLGEETRVDRRIQYAVLVLTVAGLAVGASISIAISASVGWGLLTFLAVVLLGSGIAAAVIRGRRRGLTK